MSNNPSIKTTEAQEIECALALSAIEWIDTLPQRIRLILIAGAMQHHLSVTKTEAAHAIDCITDTLGDLFSKDRHRLMGITGYIPVAAA